MNTTSGSEHGRRRFGAVAVALGLLIVPLGLQLWERSSNPQRLQDLRIEAINSLGVEIGDQAGLRQVIVGLFDRADPRVREACQDYAGVTRTYAVCLKARQAYLAETGDAL